MNTCYNLFSGEKIQSICDIYISNSYDLEYNPYINNQKNKHLLFENIKDNYENPKLIFTYTHTLDELIKHINKFNNKFILITHNSDNNINDKYLNLLNNPLLIQWFTQNPCINHNKLSFLPIGIANSMWQHGNIDIIKKNLFCKNKDFLIYFNFNIDTNVEKRLKCKNILINKGIVFLPSLPFEEYSNILSRHKYSICPDGNGIDSHRIWESLYYGTIPIILRSTFSEYIKLHYPCILLDSWDDLSFDTLEEYNESPFTEETIYKLSFEYFLNIINSF